jgi:hypothetical protein
VGCWQRYWTWSEYESRDLTGGLLDRDIGHGQKRRADNLTVGLLDRDIGFDQNRRADF